MTPTEELRKSLDELGVKWWEDVYDSSHRTIFDGTDGVCYCVYQLGTCLFIRGLLPVTPAQAIAATVGAGTLTAEQVRECAKGVYFEGYGDGATHRANGIEETDWQTIADKLNATLGAGTCKDLGGIGANGEQVFHCSECGCVMSLYDRDGSNNLCTDYIYDYPRFCPACGRKVIESKEEAE